MSIHTTVVAATTLLLLTLLAGCTLPGGSDDHRPGLEVSITPQPTLRDLPVEIHVAFENTARQDFMAVSPTGCLQVELLVRTAEGTAIPVEDPRDVECDPGRTEFRIDAGERMEWGPFPFTPGEWQTGHREPRFPPGEHTVEVRFRTDSTSWDADGSTPLEIIEGELPKIEILPETPQWPQGESRNITLRLVNTAPVPYHYTSENDCGAIELRIMASQTRLWPADGPYACNEVETEFTLDDGEQITTVVVWDASADGESGEPYVPPGDHWLQAELAATHADWDVGASESVTILENE